MKVVKVFWFMPANINSNVLNMQQKHFHLSSVFEAISFCFNLNLGQWRKHFIIIFVVCLYSALSISGEDSKRSSDNLFLFALFHPSQSPFWGYTCRQPLRHTFKFARAHVKFCSISMRQHYSVRTVRDLSLTSASCLREAVL